MAARVKAGLLPLTGVMEGTSLAGMERAVGGGDRARNSSMWVWPKRARRMTSGKPARVLARASEPRNISGDLAAADVAVPGEGGVGVDAGRNVGHDPDVVVGRAGGGELGAEPGDLLGGGVAGGGAAAGGVALGLEDVLEDDEAGVADGRGEGDGVVAELGKVVEDGRAVGGRQCVSGEAGGVGLEEGAVGVFAVVLAAGVVVAEGEVDGGVGEGVAELEGDEGDGLCGEGGVVGGGGRGSEGVEAAVELVGHEVAGDGDEERVGLLLAGGVEAGLEEGGRGVDALGVAGGLEAGEVGGLGGGGGRRRGWRPSRWRGWSGGGRTWRGRGRDRGGCRRAGERGRWGARGLGLGRVQRERRGRAGRRGAGGEWTSRTMASMGAVGVKRERWMD